MTEDRLLRCAVVLGPRKCGTTTLYSLLSQVPGLAVPGPKKEVHLFDEGPICFRKLKELGRHNLTAQTPAFIDVATHYFSEQQLWENIVQTPEVKHVIVMIRDPIERFISHCLHHMRTENEWTLTVDKIITLHPEVVFDSLYSERIPALHEVFGKDNVLLINFEDLKVDPNDVAERVCARLGVEAPEGKLALAASQKNSGLKPKFPVGYRLLRKSVGHVRRIIGDGLTEHIKQMIIRIWPVVDSRGIKQEVEEQLLAHQVGKRLIQEREYVDELLRWKNANSNCL